MTVPLVLLNQVDPVRCDWLVPGMLRDKVQALMKSLPQRLRRHLVPLPEQAQAFVARWADHAGERPLIAALIDDIAEMHGVRAQPTDFRIETLPAHLLMNFRLLGEHGVRLAMGRNIAQIKAEHGDRAQGAFRQALDSLGLAATTSSRSPDQSPSTGPVRTSRQGGSSRATTASEAVIASEAAASRGLLRAGQRYTDWQFGALPELMELEQRVDGRVQMLIGYPALIDKLDCVEVAVFDEPERAVREHRAGLIRLFALALREPLKFFDRNIADFQRLALQFASFGSGDDLRRDLMAAVIERACLGDPLPCDADSFKGRVQEARPRLALIGQELVRTVSEVLAEHAQLHRKWPTLKAHPGALADIEAQLQSLLGRRFIATTPWAQLRHLPRYVKALAMRIDKLREDAARDARLQAEITPLVLNLRRAQQQRRGLEDARLEEFRWMLEELRVSLFAQTLRTPMPVSVKRLQKAWEALRG
jgi:ATP-dependent helicase HrpA